MDVYTLDRQFMAKDTIDDIQSLIWTERYTDAGDVRLTLEDTPENRLKLSMDTFLACTDSDEVMLLETREVRDGLLTVTGPTITKFLDHRVIRASGYWNAQSIDFTDKKPGYLMSFLVQQTCIEGLFVQSEFPLFGVNGYRQKIHNLSLGEIYEGGVPLPINVPYGPLFSAVKTLGETFHIGFKMTLDSAGPMGYSLKFDTYAGTDRTVDGPDPSKMVVFSPTMDSLNGTSILESIAGYKNVCYAFATNWATPSYAYGMGEAYAPGFNPSATDFDRRVMMIFVDEIQIPEGTPTTDAFGRPPGDPPPGHVLPALNSRARDALANNNYTRLVDGEVVPQSQYKWGVDYFMGDIIGLSAGEDFPMQKAQITEYIRTKDQDGERAYPTVSVIE